MKKKKLTLKETFEFALQNYRKKNFSLTENLCNKVLSIDAHHFDSLVLLANISAINGNFTRAKELLIKANEIKPNNLSVLNNLGTACKELGDSKKAMSFYEKVIKFHPNHTNAQYNLGVMYATGVGVEKDAVEAVKWYRKAVEQNNPTAQYRLGFHYANGQGVE